jgi:hypothetical protein
MGYTRTQIYLDADDHRRLSEAAKKQGKPLTGLLREIVHRYLREGPDATATRGLEPLIGIAGGDGKETDVETNESAYLEDARAARARKKLGRST